MIERVISGFQTGADIGAMRAAKKAGIQTGGWMTRDWATEDGKKPAYEYLYDAKATDSLSYVDRTRKNVSESGLILWFGNPASPGGRATLSQAGQREIPYCTIPVELDKFSSPTTWYIDWLKEKDFIKTVLFAGNRESSCPGIGNWVELYCTELFSILGESIRRIPYV